MSKDSQLGCYDGLRAEYEAIVYQRRTSSWRINADAADEAWSLYTDRLLRGDPPAVPLAWLLATYFNKLKAGPDRVGLKRSALLVDCAGSLATDLDCILAASRTCEILARVGVQDEFLRRLNAALTFSERLALDARNSCSSREVAARVAGMSRRDYSVRLRRGRSKGSAILRAMIEKDLGLV